MKFFERIIFLIASFGVAVSAPEAPARILEKSADAVIVGKVWRIDDTQELVQVAKGVWMIRIKCHVKVLEIQRGKLGKQIVVERLRNVIPTDRRLFSDDRSYVLAMVNQPIQAELKKGDLCRAILMKSPRNGVWLPASGLLNDQDSFGDVELTAEVR